MTLKVRVFRLTACVLATALPSSLIAGETRTLATGTEIQLATLEPLSSKTSVKGDFVPLRTVEDVHVENVLVIPAGTMVSGQISDARTKGAMGMSGRLSIRPLYIQIGVTTVRLMGASSGKGSVTAGAVAGMVLLTPGFTGRSALIPKGARFSGFVERSVELPAFTVKPR